MPLDIVAQNPASVKACLARRQSLPTLPTTFTRLMGVVNNPNLNLVDLAEIISTDPILMANVLRVANSSYMGLKEPVSNLSEAILYLGMEDVKRIALSVGSFDVFKAKGVSGDFLKNIWLHSLATGFISQKLAKNAQFDFHEIAYLGGLLHDLGKLFFASFYSSTYAPIRQEVANGGDGLALESQFFGMTHLDAASELCLHWNLPPKAAAGAVNHHDPSKAAEDDRLFVYCVAAANILAHKIVADEPVESRLPLLQTWLDELAKASGKPELADLAQLEPILVKEVERAKRLEETRK